jgi:phosphoglucosamine mutase
MATATRTGMHVICNDIARDERMVPSRDHALRLGYGALASFPLRVAGQTRGAISLYTREAGFFDDEEIKLLDELAGEIERYPHQLVNVRIRQGVDVLGNPAVQDALISAERELDGGGRVLLRPSGTEPLIRVMVEGADDAQVLTIANRLADVVRSQLPA